MNLIAVYALANEANIETTKQISIQVGDRNSSIQPSRQYICISSQYTCVSNRQDLENLGSAKDSFSESL